MIFIFILCAIVGNYLLAGILSLFNIDLFDGNENVMLYLSILIGIALHINYRFSNSRVRK